MKAATVTASLQLLEHVLAEIAKNGPEGFSALVDHLDAMDAISLAQDRLGSLAEAHFRKEAEVADEIGSAVPHLGHLLIRSTHDTAFSISVRWPLSTLPRILSTSGRAEYHRIVSGLVEVRELQAPHAGADSYTALPLRVLDAGQSILVHPNSSAIVLVPRTRSVIFSVSGPQTSRFHANVDGASGKLIGRSLSDSNDSILCNVLELCCRFPSPGLAAEVLLMADHVNHRVRLAALKAAASLGGLSAKELIRRCEDDPHPLINRIAVRAKEIA